MKSARVGSNAKSSGKSRRPRFFVYIIESPSPDDFLKERCEGRLLTEALRLAEIETVFRTAVDRDCFIDCLYQHLAPAVTRAQAYPMVHISAHGNEDGIVLTDGSSVEWRQLRELLLPINTFLQGGLVICLSSCSGFAACRMAMESGDVPFLALVAPRGTPSWGDTAVAYTAFYHRFYNGATPTEAVAAMKSASGNDSFATITGKDVQNIWMRVLREETAETTRLTRSFPKPPTSVRK